MTDTTLREHPDEPPNRPGAAGQPDKTLNESAGARPEREATWNENASAGAPEGDDGFSWTQLPPPLSNEWSVVEELPSGGESIILLVAPRRGDGPNRILKVYHRNLVPKTEVLERLGELDRAHVVEMISHGDLRQRRYEILEYLEHGSLATLVGAGGARMPEPRVREVLEELLEAIEHIHQHDIIHRDLKPGNILIRSLDPLDLVLTDFGIASALGGSSLRRTSHNRTPHYAARETIYGEVSRKSDWWSMGIILVELLTGRHPFAREGSTELLETDEANKRLMNDPVDDLVQGVTGPWRKLCRGLLRRETANRWGASEVRRWLSDPDEAPEIIEEHQSDRRPFRFSGTQHSYYEPGDVARALSEHWDEAIAALGHGEVLSWVRDLQIAPLTQRLETIDREFGDDLYPVDAALFRALIALDPAIIPTFMGCQLSDHGLRRLADGAREGDARSGEVLQALFEQDILSTYSDLCGTRWHRDVERGWDAQARSYVELAGVLPESVRPDLEQALPLAIASGLRGILPDAQRPHDARALPWLERFRSQVQGSALRGRHLPRWYRELVRRIPRMSAAQLILPVASARQALQDVQSGTDLTGRIDPRRLLLMFARAALVILLVVGVSAAGWSVWRSSSAQLEKSRAGRVVSGITFGTSVEGNRLRGVAAGSPPRLRASPTIGARADIVDAKPGTDAIKLDLVRGSAPVDSCAVSPDTATGHIMCQFAISGPGTYMLRSSVNGVAGPTATVEVTAPAKS